MTIAKISFGYNKPVVLAAYISLLSMTLLILYAIIYVRDATYLGFLLIFPGLCITLLCLFVLVVLLFMLTRIFVRAVLNRNGICFNEDVIILERWKTTTISMISIDKHRSRVNAEGGVLIYVMGGKKPIRIGLALFQGDVQTIFHRILNS